MGDERGVRNIGRGRKRAYGERVKRRGTQRTREKITRKKLEDGEKKRGRWEEEEIGARKGGNEAKKRRK